MQDYAWYLSWGLHTTRYITFFVFVLSVNETFWVFKCCMLHFIWFVFCCCCFCLTPGFRRSVMGLFAFPLFNYSKKAPFSLFLALHPLSSPAQMKSNQELAAQEGIYTGEELGDGGLFRRCQSRAPRVPLNHLQSGNPHPPRGLRATYRGPHFFSDITCSFFFTKKVERAFSGNRNRLHET